jgi:hypothetical protein
VHIQSPAGDMQEPDEAIQAAQATPLGT